MSIQSRAKAKLKEEHVKVNGKKKLNWFPVTLVAVILVFVFSLVAWCSYRAENKTHFTSNYIEKRYNELMTKISPTLVREDITPVFLYLEDNGKKYFCATGGLLADNTIMTSGHSFWEKPAKRKVSRKFYYRKLQPLETVYRPINRIAVVESMDANTLNVSRDVIMCYPGEAQPITNILERESERVAFPATAELLREAEIVRSTITGENVRMIGSIKWSNTPKYSVLDYEAVPGQSGTIFVGDDGKTVHIQSRIFPLDDEFREKFKLPPYRKFISLCSSVNLTRN